MDKNKEQEIKDFQNFIIAEAKSKGKDPNAYAKELGEDGMKEAYKRFQAQKQKKAQKAAHGAKLQYFRTLKNQCPEGEELYYYKKGGSVGCGCKKKEEGGEVQEAKCGAVAKFKKVRKGGFGITAYADAVTNSQGFANAKKKKKEQKKTLTFQGKPQMIIGKDVQRGSGNDTSEQEKKDKSAKDYYSGKQHIQGRKCGGSVKKDACGSKVVKAFKEKCGAKMKKHQQGGSLNRIPFYQDGIKRGINGEYYTNPIPWNAGNGSAGDSPLIILEKNVTSNPNIITGEAPGVGKAKGMIRAAKEASKISGKKFTPILRNAQGKRSSTLGAITANDIDESKVIVGQGVRKTTQPFKHDPYHPSNINRAANYYVKENNLETFIGPNGKMYVKTKDGKVRSFEAVGKEYIDNSGFGW